MKRLGLTIMVILAVAFFASTSHAYSLRMYDAYEPNYQVNRLTGGPFEAHVLSAVPAGMKGTLITAGSLIPGDEVGGLKFRTFCLETTEYFNYSGTYSFTLDSYAAMGGAGGATSGQDPLDTKTAYLYYNFRMHEADYDQMALQAAIWHIENEITLPTEELSDPTQSLAWGYVNNSGNWTNIGPVRVMNLMFGGSYKQSQLALVPEPTSLLLLGLGLIGLAGVRRKFKK